MGSERKPLRGAIVAMTRQRVIGLDGDLPWHYPGDLKRFKRRTMGHPVVMGRKTWQSIGERPLPGRRNIVVSRAGRADGVECYPAIEAALDACGDDDAWVIGGGQIYRGAMPQLNLIDITWVPDAVSGAGAITFPTLDGSEWVLEHEAPLAEDHRLVNAIYLRRGRGPFPYLTT